MEGVTYRTEPQQSDVEDIKAIVSSLGYYDEAEIRVAVDLVQERLDRGLACNYLFIFADFNGRAISFACFGPIPCAKNNFELYWMSTHKDYGHKGVAREILRRVERVVWAFNGRALYLSTSSKPVFIPTREFLLKTGYRVEATLFNFYDENEHRMMFTKRFI